MINLTKSLGKCRMNMTQTFLSCVLDQMKGHAATWLTNENHNKLEQSWYALRANYISLSSPSSVSRTFNVSQGEGSFPVPLWSDGKELWGRGWLQTLLRKRLALCFSLGSVFFSFLLAIYSWCCLGQCTESVIIPPQVHLLRNVSFIMQPI